MNFEELDLNGQTVTMTLAQHNQFDDIIDSAGGGGIIITDPVDPASTVPLEVVQADGDVSAYTIANSYGEPVQVDLAATGGELSQDLTILTARQGRRGHGPSVAMNGSTVLTGDGDDTVDLSGVTKVTDSTVKGEAGNDTIDLGSAGAVKNSTIDGGIGNDTIDINGVVTINPTDILGGDGSDVINANSLETVAAGSDLARGQSAWAGPDERELNALLEGTVDGGSATTCSMSAMTWARP